MSTASRKRARLGRSEGLAEEGSAARTRPVSVEEIMLRRKQKGSLESVKEEATLGVKSGGDDVVVGMVSDHRQAERRSERHSRDSLHGSEKLRSEASVKDGSRKKEETARGEDRYDKLKHQGIHGVDAIRRVDGERHKHERKLKVDKEVRGMDAKMKAVKERYGSKLIKEQTHARDSVSEQAGRANEPTKLRLRSLVVMNQPSDENSRKHGESNKKKHQNRNDRRDKKRITSEKPDMRKGLVVEGSESKDKMAQPRIHYHKKQEKRRRSRSRDHGKDKHRQPSPPPRAEKATSHRKREHEELSASSLKERAGRQSGDGGNKDGINGSTNQSRRYSGSKSGLGGYSPRRRREDAPFKASSPPTLSPERKSAKWDLTPAGTVHMLSGSVLSGLQTAMETTVYAGVNEAALNMLQPLTEMSFKIPPAKQKISIDSVQLTESTRRMRRLYVENVPDSASEKSLIECFNTNMLSSGFNHIQGSDPCISCIISKEKGQALVEFLTPEDASSALSLDGCLFAGSSLKIRRPKDFVETTTNDLDKKEAATNVLSDTVEDSPNKIFIGGISNDISAEMLSEIVSVFGSLKAYHFEKSSDHNKSRAFLEYADGSVTLKACAGLNGLKLGGNVITAVPAFPDVSSVMAKKKNQPLYAIPEHAKPLLRKPTNVLKLKNVIDPETFSSISETELKEILEDVQLECARYGTINSINIVHHRISETAASETDAPTVCSEKEGGTEEGRKEEGEGGGRDSRGEKEENRNGNEKEGGSRRGGRTRWEPVETSRDEREEEEEECKLEEGCILVEYGRREASCESAHSLQGRMYGDRVVKVEYVSEEHYKTRFRM